MALTTALAGLLSLSPGWAPASEPQGTAPAAPVALDRSAHAAPVAAQAVDSAGVLPPASGTDERRLLASVGPREPARPEGVVASDEAHLRSLVEAVDGPPDIWLEARIYRTGLQIRRPVRLRGARGAVVEGPGEGTVIDIESDDVLIDNLTVRGSGTRHTTEDAGIKAKGRRIAIEHTLVDRTLFGISLQLCQHCTVKGCHVIGPPGDMTFRGDGIKLWEASDGVVEGNLVEDTRDVVVWYSRRVVLNGNTVRRGRYGTHFMYAHDAVVRGGRLTENVVGVFVMYSARMRLEGNVLAGAHGAAGMGVGFKDSDSIELAGNWLVANSTGVYLDRTPRSESTPVRFESNVIAINDVGIRLHSSEHGLSFTRNDFVGNAALAEVEGGGDALGVVFKGNHFSEYEGYDLDGDGLGDVPFEQKRLSSELTDAHQQLRFFQGTAALGLFDVVAHAVPVFAARKLLTDPQPAVRPHEKRIP
jgi:nitrous oxidase accessory protein